MELMDRVNKVRPRLRAGRGRDLLGPVAHIDVDGTIAPTTGQRRAGMDMPAGRWLQGVAGWDEGLIASDGPWLASRRRRRGSG